MRKKVDDKLRHLHMEGNKCELLELDLLAVLSLVILLSDAEQVLVFHLFMLELLVAGVQVTENVHLLQYHLALLIDLNLVVVLVFSQLEIALVVLE